MKSTELRIGNWIYYTTDKTNFKATAKTILYFSDIYFKPIPLTEDWLKKFGFTRIVPSWADIKRIDKDDYYLIRDDVYFNEKKIKYVHQLQNLYFALTGKELKL